MHNNSVKFAFFGTDQFAVKVLNILKDRGLLPSLIVTRPDKPVGRKQVLTAPPTKIWGTINNIEIVQPESLKNVPESLTTDHPARHASQVMAGGYSLFMVASYGKIIPQTILDLPKLGTLNIHPSLLPKYRGASPLEYTILNGDTETGITVMLMDAEMDHGPILAVGRCQVSVNSVTYPELRDQLAELGANTLANIIPDFLAGHIKPIEQNHNEATYTKLIKKEDGEIDPFGDPETAWRKYRAFIDWPGVYFFLDTPKQGVGGSQKTRIIVKKARFENGQFVIERVVPEGKTEVDWVNP